MVAAAHPLASAGRRRGAARRRLGGRRGGGGADHAQPRRAAELGDRRRRLPAVLGRLGGAADQLRRAARPRRRRRRPTTGSARTATPLAFWDAVVGGRSVGVPGDAAAARDAPRRATAGCPGRTLFAPAIALAEEGFPVSPRLAAAIAEAAERGSAPFPRRARLFLRRRTARRCAEGALRDNPDFARTLRLIAAEGAAPFYEGAIAGDIVAAVRTETNPGLLTAADLAGYRVIERPPVCVDYRVAEVCGMGPPSSGGADGRPDPRHAGGLRPRARPART